MKPKIIKPIKPAKRRPPTKRRKNIFTCPQCLSILKLSETGHLICKGANLKLWENEVLKYKKLSKIEKMDYLKDLENSDKFLELVRTYEIEGKLECGYSNKMINSLGGGKVTIPDPLQVKSIERILKRELTPFELEEGAAIKVGDAIMVLNRISLPEDV